MHCKSQVISSWPIGTAPHSRMWNSNRPWGPPSLLYNGYRVFPGRKERSGHDVDPSPPSSVIGHERVELYLYSPYGPYGLCRASVPVQGCTLYCIKYDVLCNPWRRMGEWRYSVALNLGARRDVRGLLFPRPLSHRDSSAGIYWIGVWVGPRGCPDVRRRNLSLTGNRDTQFVGRPARSLVHVM